jgi:thiol-disulfide isomerase/thioredoxin
MKLKLASALGLFLVLAVALVGFTAWHSARSDAPPQDGVMAKFKLQAAAQAASASFLDETGQATDLTRFKGKVTLVNLWATWCQPCIKEMPSLERLMTQRESEHFTVATISEDAKGAAAVEPFFAKNGLAGLPRFVDPELALSQAFKVDGLPTTLLLDAEGREIGRFEGPAEWDGPEALRLIDWYLAHQG